MGAAQRHNTGTAAATVDAHPLARHEFIDMFHFLHHSHDVTTIQAHRDFSTLCTRQFFLCCTARHGAGNRTNSCTQ